ncbi:hypothetical protein EHS25_001660 [Saitozyma podzolica]|uniref:Uncharacterized protein n=1 Tax=Saitozyma podzolica TaxID=1890683 RepID=A0A427YGT0_9TREE|nr:hypothetical protein EHS25_001660 [Saitozyma podzolica]
MKRSTSSSPAPILDAAITLTPSPKKPKKSPFGGSGTSRSNSIPSPSHKARIPPPQKTALARAIIMAGLGAVKVDELAREINRKGDDGEAFGHDRIPLKASGAILHLNRTVWHG